MAFRTGRHVAAMAERLCPPVEHSESWTYIFPGINKDLAESKLDEFHLSNVSCFSDHVIRQVHRLTAREAHPTP